MNAFTNALIQRISEEEGVPLTIINMNSLSLLSWLKQEQNAGILTGLTPTAENREKYQFSDPYLLLGPVLVVRVDSNVNSLEDLKEKFVGVYAFDDSIFVVQKNPAILIQTYENMPTGLADLAVGTLDALVMPVLDANALVSSQYAGILRIATPPLTDKGLRLVTLKGREEALIALFNHGLKQLQDKGEYRRIKANFIF